MAHNLATVVAPFAPHYDTLNTYEGGFLRYDGVRGWYISPNPPEELIVAYRTVVQALVQMDPADYQAISSLQELAQRINVTYGETIFRGSIPKQFVHFNSRGDCPFLSNFHFTLILFDDFDHPGRRRFFSSSEMAYQAHKLANVCQNLPLARRVVASVNPGDAKELAKGAVGHSVKKGPSPLMQRITIMEGVVSAKFACNPTLMRWLQMTSGRLLVEKTTHATWGCMNPKDPTLQQDCHRPVKETSKNVLGIFLMRVRQSDLA